MSSLDVDDHAFLGGRLILREPRHGHRSGSDAILLAAASRPATGEHLVDIGAGAGAAALAALVRSDGSTATLVERDVAMAGLARHNIEANGLDKRAEVVVADIFDPEGIRLIAGCRADVVISNPPFYVASKVRASSDPLRAAAHVLSGGGHGDWMRRLLRAAKPRGRVVVIHRPDALPSLIDAVGARGAIALRTIHAAQGRPANRVLLDVKLGRRSPLTIDPGLILHETDGSFTPQAEDLHQGRTWL